MNYYNYFTEIEETFIRRRGRNLLLSPLDWALIESWQEREIPLHIILRGIEKVFDTVDKQPDRKRSVKSLFYCKEEIEAQYAEWLEMQVGKNGKSEVESRESGVGSREKPDAHSAKSELFSPEAIAVHLEKVEIDLQNARQKAVGDLRENLQRVLNRLAELKTGRHSAENLEESLEKLDALVDASLLKTTSTENLQTEIESALISYRSKMEPEVFRRTVELMLIKKLREEAKVPRLSLFYL